MDVEEGETSGKGVRDLFGDDVSDSDDEGSVSANASGDARSNVQHDAGRNDDDEVFEGVGAEDTAANAVCIVDYPEIGTKDEKIVYTKVRRRRCFCCACAAERSPSGWAPIYPLFAAVVVVLCCCCLLLLFVVCCLFVVEFC